jgi:hypothetical protein
MKTTLINTHLNWIVTLTALMLAQAHQKACSEDEHLLQEVAQKIRREQGSLVVSELDPSKRTRIANRIAVRAIRPTGCRTPVRRKFASIRSERHRPPRRPDERRVTRSRRAHARHPEAAGTELPTDVVLSRTARPMTTSRRRLLGTTTTTRANVSTPPPTPGARLACRGWRRALALCRERCGASTERRPFARGEDELVPRPPPETTHRSRRSRSAASGATCVRLVIASRSAYHTSPYRSAPSTD